MHAIPLWAQTEQCHTNLGDKKYLGSKWEQVSAVEVTSETNVYVCFTRSAVTNLALGNNHYLAVFLKTIVPGHSC